MEIESSSLQQGSDNPVASSAVDVSLHRGDLKKVAAGTGINLLGSASRTIFLFAYAAFLAFFLDPDEVGLYFLALTIVTLLGVVATLGLDTGIIRFVSLYKGEKDDAKVRGTVIGALAIALPAGMITGLLLYLFAGPIAESVFSKPDLAPVLRIFSPLVPLLVAAKLFNSGTQGLRFMRYQVYSRDVGEQMLKFFISVTFLIAGLGLLGVVSANVVALAIATFLSFYFLQRVEPIIGRAARRSYDFPRLLGYSVPLAASAILTLLLLWTDTLMLGYFRPAEEVGIYSVAMRIVTVGFAILVSFNTMFAPVASDFYNRDEHERLQQLFKSVTKWSAGVSLPIFAVLALFPAQALRVMGSEYTNGADALTILAIGHFINAAAGPASLMLMMCGKPRVMLVNNLVVFIADVLLCIFLIPRFGMVGSALCFSISLLLFNLVALVSVLYMLKLQPFNRDYGKLMIAGAAAVLSSMLMRLVLPAGWNLVAALGVFLVVYCVLAPLLAFDKSDLFLVTSIRQKVMKSKMPAEREGEQTI